MSPADEHEVPADRPSDSAEGAAALGEQRLRDRVHGGLAPAMPGPTGPNQVTETVGDPGAEDPREAADGGGAAGAVIGTLVGGPIGMAVGGAVGAAAGGVAGAATRTDELPDDRAAQAAEAEARAGRAASATLDPRTQAEQAARDDDRGGVPIGDDVPGPDGSDPT